MEMKGTVIGINANKGLVAVSTNYGITVLELLDGSDISINDVITGNLDSHGDETFLNETQSQEMEVYVDAVHCDKTTAKSLMS